MVQKYIPFDRFNMMKLGNWTFCYENVTVGVIIYCDLVIEKVGLKHWLNLE